MACSLIGLTQNVALTDTEDIVSKVTTANVELNPELKKTVKLFALDWNICSKPDSRELLRKKLTDHKITNVDLILASDVIYHTS